MFYSDNLGRLMPLVIAVLACLAFWAFAAYNFPDWTFLILAAVSGVFIALALGRVLDRRLRRQLGERELDETVRRRKIQEELDDAGRRS